MQGRGDIVSKHQGSLLRTDYNKLATQIKRKGNLSALFACNAMPIKVDEGFRNLKLVTLFDRTCWLHIHQKSMDEQALEPGLMKFEENMEAVTILGHRIIRDDQKKQGLDYQILETIFVEMESHLIGWIGPPASRSERFVWNVLLLLELSDQPSPILGTSMLGFPSFSVYGEGDKGEELNRFYHQPPSVISNLNSLYLFTSTLRAKTSSPLYRLGKG
ncbi:hypothetical protein BC332_16731 [Capsicum chinense]|nr:hypothetical protein BC332_16731 [Capsicum chinense]